MDPKPDIVKEKGHLQFTRLRIIKNLILISCTFALHFTAYHGISMLQSTMNRKQGIGSASQAVVFFTFAIASLILPKYTIKKLGCKMTLFFGVVLFLPYIAANAYPTWFTMMPSAVLIGAGIAILWASQSTYFNEAAGLYCNLVENCKPGKKPMISKKLGGRNCELFAMQNGIDDKMLLKSGQECEGIISNQNCHGIQKKECREISKCFGVKIISENNQDLKTIAHNIKEKLVKETEFGKQNDKNINTHDDETTSLNNKKITGEVHQLLKIGNVNSQLEDSVVNGVSKITENDFNNELIINSGNKNMTSVNDNEFLNSTIVPENTSQICTIESVTSRFFGCFGMMYSTAQVWSNLISYYVLNVNSQQNETFISNHSCGARFCNSEFEVLNGGTDEISSSTRYLLIGIAVTLSFVSSLLLLVFLDPLDTPEADVKFSLSHAMATLNHLKKKEQLFIIPLSMLLGMLQGFYTADFTKAYIQCAWSISYVGLVTIFYGLACGISCMISGCVVKYVGRIPVVLLGLALHLGIDVFLMVWNPNSENHFMFYLAAALWGANIGIFWSQIQALYGLLFKDDEEAAFAANYFCSAMGWTISFAYSDYLCTLTKIYILMGVSCIGIIGYLAADRSFRQRKVL